MVETQHKAATAKRTTKHRGGWRSRGWIPLSYPSTALMQAKGESNRLFPYHEAVLSAAARELLILDGTLNYTTLKVKTEAVRLMDRQQESEMIAAPRYRVHTEPSCWKVADEEVYLQKKEKGKSVTGKRKADIKESKAKKQKVSDDVPAMVNEPDAVPSDDVPTGETLAQMIVQRACMTPATSLTETTLDSSEKHENTQFHAVATYTHSRPPRKVSDSDHFTPDDLLPETLVTEQTIGHRDISRFVSLYEKAPDGSLIFKRKDLPTLLESSIATESSLRSTAYRMTANLVQSFSDHTLRLFLGYKTPTLARQKLVRVVADFLFDASHAMFAWEQTEREFGKETPTRSFDRETLHKIKDALFDTRALRKVGGFEDSSILPHAISTKQLKAQNTSWEDFARSDTGKRMLQHHQDMDSCIHAGFRRRGQRLRQRSANKTDSKEQRPRSWSTASSDFDEVACSEDGSIVAPFFAEVPAASNIRLMRAPGTSWGVLLAKEGDMCVVVRGSKASNNERGDTQLQSGDLVLRVENEHGEAALSPSFSAKQGEKVDEQGWFRSTVDLFKKSHQLNLVVRRIGGPSNQA